MDDGHVVRVGDARAFSSALAMAKSAEAGGGSGGPKGEAGSKGARSGRGWRHVQLWNSHDRRLILQGIRLRRPGHADELCGLPMAWRRSSGRFGRRLFTAAQRSRRLALTCFASMGRIEDVRRCRSRAGRTSCWPPARRSRPPPARTASVGLWRGPKGRTGSKRCSELWRMGNTLRRG